MSRKKFFDEDLAYAQMLKMSDGAMVFLESKRDSEIKENPDDSENIMNKYKGKLQSIYRVRNNAFALMLRQGYECTAFYTVNGGEKKPTFSMEIDGKNYTLDALSLKNVLFKDYDTIISDTFDAENSKISLSEVLSVSGKAPKQNKQNDNKVQNTVNTPVTEEVKSTKKQVENKEISDDIFNIMQDVSQNTTRSEAKPEPEQHSKTNIGDLMPIIDDELESVELDDNNSQTAPAKRIHTEETLVFSMDDKSVSSHTKEETIFDAQDGHELSHIQEIITDTQNTDNDFDVQITDEPVMQESNSDEKPNKVSQNLSAKDFIVDEPTYEVSISENDENIEEENDQTEENDDELSLDSDFEIVDFSGDDDSDFEIMDFSSDNDFEVEDFSAEEKIEVPKPAPQPKQKKAIKTVPLQDTKAQEEKPVRKVEPKRVEKVTPIVNTVSEQEEKPIIKVKKTASDKKLLCPHCRTKISENETICSKCGYDLVSKEVTEADFEDMLDEEQFDENDIKKILDEIKADYEKAKREEREAEERAKRELEEKNKSKFDLSKAPKNYVQDEFKSVEMYCPEDSDPIKLKAELICDIYNIKAYDPIKEDDDPDAERTIRDIKIIAYPLKIPENGTLKFSECAIYVEEDGERGCYRNDYNKTGSVRVQTRYHNFILQWNWLEGKPSSRIILAAEQKNIIECNKIAVRPNIEDLSVVGYGHPTMKLSAEYLDSTTSILVHALLIPDVPADENGNLPCLFVIEDPENERRDLVLPKDGNYVMFFAFDENNYISACKDKGDQIVLTVEEYK